MMYLYQHLFNIYLIKILNEPVLYGKCVLVAEEVFVVFFAVALNDYRQNAVFVSSDHNNPAVVIPGEKKEKKGSYKCVFFIRVGREMKIIASLLFNTHLRIVLSV